MIENKLDLFFPYYVNQARLLDLYAILNDGYSEFSELTLETINDRHRDFEAGVNANGFRLLNIGANVSGKVGKSKRNRGESKERKIHTVTSVLSMVKNELSQKGYLSNITQAKAGDFVCLPVNLSINSMKSLLGEIAEVMKQFGSTSTNKKEVKDVEKIANQINILFDGEEMVCDKGTYAVFGNIVDSHFYQATRTDVIGIDMQCLAQVKKVFPKGTELMKNTVFTKVKDMNTKAQFFSAMDELSQKDIYDFEAVAIPSIHDKPVYQLEIIALYQ